MTLYLLHAQHLPVERTAKAVSAMLGADVSTGFVASLAAEAAASSASSTPVVPSVVAGVVRHDGRNARQRHRRGVRRRLSESSRPQLLTMTLVNPDGLGRWEEAGYQVIFCLEYDRSTETLERLEKKLKSYEDLQVASGLAYWICFCLRHPRREAGARRVLAQATVPVATAALGPTQRPHEPIWAPIGYEGIRLRLADLAGVPIPAESEERIEETQEHRRRMEEQR